MFRLEIETSNAAFQDYDGFEVARILRDVAQRLEDAFTQGTVKDINGNTVGSFTLDTE